MANDSKPRDPGGDGKDKGKDKDKPTRTDRYGDLNFDDFQRIRENNPDRWADIKDWLKDRYPNRWDRIQDKFRAANGGSGEDPDPGAYDPDNPMNQAVYDQLVQQFIDLGVGDLSGLIMDYLIQGFTPDVIGFMLQDTPEYKARFAGNEEIKKRIAAGESGLHVLSPAEYIQQEKLYRDVLSYYGLPSGFYDDPTDFSGWIGKGVSVNEINDRARMAKETVNGSPEVVEALRRYYPELNDGDVMAYILDQKRALPIIEQRVNAANIGGAGAMNHLNVSQDRAEDLARYGVTADQARQGYGMIADSLGTSQKLAELEGSEFSQSDLEDEVFKSDAAAGKKRKGLASRERARFAASGGTNQYTFSKDKGDY